METDGTLNRTELKGRRLAIGSGEGVFLCVFLVFFALRGYWSDTNGNNGEKAMDSALIGTSLRAQKLPPPNPYSATSRLDSYYYFGHLQTALLTRSSNTTARWSYNLMCATLPALCASLLFSLGAGLTRRLDGGAFVAGTVLGLGTLQPIFQWFKPDGPLGPLFRGEWSALSNINLDLVNRLAFFDVSRPVPFQINEFPFFTFNQADLHAHYFAFPLALAQMSLAWAIFRSPTERRRRVLLGVAAAFSGAQILTNTWDFPAYALAVGLAFCLAPRDKTEATSAPFNRALWLGGAVVGALALASPYLLGLNTAARGPSPLPQPASPLREWLLLWGPILLAWMGFSAASTFRFDGRWRAGMGLVAALILLAAPFFQRGWGYPEGMDKTSPEALAQWFERFNVARLVLPLIVASAFISLLGATYNRGVTRFLPCLALAGMFSLLWAETTWAGFLGDPNNPGFGDYKRQDTPFKFGMQVWFLWGTAASAGAYLTLKRWPMWLKLSFVPLLLVMAISSLVDMRGRTRGFDRTQRQNWDAWAHLKPGEQAAATWLEFNTRPGQNILEAEMREGGDYTEYTRYAHATGIPTIIGPGSHSFQWSPNNERLSRNAGESGADFLGRKQGSQWEAVTLRKTHAREAFTTQDAAKRRDILARYGVRYVVWGELERTQYGEPSREFLARDLKQVASFDDGPGDDPARRVEIFEVK